MIDRVDHRFALKPTRLIGDMAYGAADLLAWMVNDKAIEPHVPVWDKTQRTDNEADRRRAAFARIQRVHALADRDQTRRNLRYVHRPQL